MYKFLLILLSIFLLYNLYLSRPTNLKRYDAKYAVVTGATGGIGQEIVSRLVKQELKVIAVGRNALELQKLKTRFPQVFTFKFDFSGNLSNFAPEFDAFLLKNQISPGEIGICYSNAGQGWHLAFDQTTFQCKTASLQINLNSHICVTDYFLKIFVQRSKQKQRSALIITSSAAAHLAAKKCHMYHVAKNALSSLGTALHAEYKRLGVDVLTVHPSAVSQTKFFQSENIKKVGDMGDTKISVTPQQVVNTMMVRLGKRNSVQVGWFAVAAAIFNSLGRNASAYVFSKSKYGKKLDKTK